MLGLEALWVFCLAHFVGIASSKLSIWPCTAVEITFAPPISHAWLYTADVGPSSE